VEREISLNGRKIVSYKICFIFYAALLPVPAQSSRGGLQKYYKYPKEVPMGVGKREDGYLMD